MKKLTTLFLSVLLLTGCASPAPGAEVTPSAETIPAQTAPLPDSTDAVAIGLSDNGISIGENAQPDAVFISHDIIFYQDMDLYDSGNIYGDGTPEERHPASEAATHTVVNIIKPGTYSVSGKLSAGQIRVDLGEDAFSDPNAVVNLILDNADITCTVAPAILFQHVYECDGDWSAEKASATVDTSAAGANLILAEGSRNTVTGSHVAKIYKDTGEEKKLWKQDGAVYSYMSMNVSGSGALTIDADNEGLDSELHLTINGGDITIRSQNDGINTNEDGVSVTTINGGNIHIIAGLGDEGDGIDSNGYLVINGGTVVAAANPASDSGLDSDMGSLINGGTVVALGSAMDWAESESGQVTMNLQYAEYQPADSAITVTGEDGSVIFAYDPAADAQMAGYARQYRGAILSSPALKVGESYRLLAGGSLSGVESNGFCQGGTNTDGQEQMFTGSDLRAGGRGGFDRGPRPDGADEQFAQRPEGMKDRPTDGNPPVGKFHRNDTDGGLPPMPEGLAPEMPEGIAPDAPMEDMLPEETDGSTAFLMQDMVNSFTGITSAAKRA